MGTYFFIFAAAFTIFVRKIDAASKEVAAIMSQVSHPKSITAAVQKKMGQRLIYDHGATHRLQ